MLVYLNTLVLIPRLFLKKRVLSYAIAAILTILAYTLLRSIYTKYILDWLFKPDIPHGYFEQFGLSLVYGIWFTIISFMLYITQTRFEQKQQVKNIQINQLQTELKYLRAQINPHFLFNGLNTIYGSIDRTNEQARDYLLQFSDLLRYSIYEADTDFVALEKETRHLENYVSLQKARSEDNLQVALNLQIENQNTLVVPLLFLPLVENAFKYVTRDDKQQNYIKINLQEQQGQISFSCLNSFDDTIKKEGIGLINVKRRLELLYKENYQLNIKQVNKEYRVDLIISL